MFDAMQELPKAAWKSIIYWTLAATGLSICISVLVTNLILDTLSQGINGPGLAASIILPLILGGPMMFYQTLRHQQLKLANQKLQVLASTDWLTACLNRRAFTQMVSEHLQGALEKPELEGALLVIDADHFKTINDRFGHDRGDEVLQIMADAIRKAVRLNDLVGRFGGEEFGVYLPGASAQMAGEIAERIRAEVSGIRFAPTGDAHPISVSVGGAVFDRRIPFNGLFRLADQMLYEVKQTGRNRVLMARFGDTPDQSPALARPRFDGLAAA